MTEELRHVYRVDIAAAPEKVWRALTDPEYTTRFWYGGAIRSDWKAGSVYELTAPDGRVVVHGRVVEIDPPRRLVQTLHSLQPPFDAERESMLIWELEPAAGGTRLTLVHEGFEPGSKMYATIGGKAGWPHILEGLKKLLEESAVA